MTVDDPIFDEDLDRSAEWRLAVLRTVVLIVVFTGLLVPAGLPLGTALLLATGTVLLSVGRSWAIERFAFTQPQAYARQIVGRHAGALLDVLRKRPDLAAEYERNGLATGHLLGCPPDAVADAAARLHAAGYPDRRHAQPWHTVIRLLTAGTGILITGLLGRALASGGVCSPAAVAELWSAMPWPNRLLLLLGLAAVTVSRAGATRHNRGVLGRAGDRFAAAATAEVSGMLGPPWRARRAAIIADLHRVLAIVQTAGAITDTGLGLRTSSELRTLEILFGAGLAIGFAGALALGC